MKNYVNELNTLEREMLEKRDSLYEEYGDHTDDADLAWSQRRQYWDDQIGDLADEAAAAGHPVHWNSDTREWCWGAYTGPVAE